MLLLPTAPIFPHAESLTWGTGILHGGNGNPQRISNGHLPRQRLTYTFPLRTDDEIARAEGVLYTQLKDVWPIPLWGQRVGHTAAIAAGATSIVVDTTLAEFVATNRNLTGRAVLWQRDKSEIVTVSEVAAGSLTVSATANAYHGAKWIVPCRSGYLISDGRLGGLGLRAGMLELQFEAIDNWFCPGHTADMEYDLADVWTEPSKVFGGGGQYGYSPDVHVIRSGTGRMSIIDITDYPQATQAHAWVCTTRAACYALRQRLHATLGRQKSFLVPTFRPNLTLAAPASAVAVEIIVPNTGLTAAYNGSYLRQYVGYCVPGSVPIVRRIESVAVVDSATEKITIADTIGVALAAGRTLSWVDRCRLASDTVTLNWRGPDKLTCQTTLVRTWRRPLVGGTGVPGLGMATA